MTRVKRSVHARKKRRKVLAQASGYWGLKSKVYRRAKEQVQHSLQYAYRDRRVRSATSAALDRPHQRRGAHPRALLQPDDQRAEAGRGRRRPQGAGRPGGARAEDVRGARRARQGGARAVIRLGSGRDSTITRARRTAEGAVPAGSARALLRAAHGPVRGAAARLAPRGQPARRHPGADRRRRRAGRIQCDPRATSPIARAATISSRNARARPGRLAARRGRDDAAARQP